METSLLKRIALVLSMPVIYFFIVSGITSPESFLEKAKLITDNPVTKDFINLIFTDTYFGRLNPNDPRAIENNLKNFTDSLHFNSVHVYGYDTLGGGFNSQLSWYSSYVSGLMNTVNNEGLKGYYGRNKIERLSYGQRLEYEIKQTNSAKVNSGFCYDSIMSNTFGSDSGRTVLHAIPYPSAGYDSAGWLCNDIYENLQHGDLIDFTQLDDSTWFIKPVMRIDSSIVDSNPEDSVVRIDVINYSGNVIKSVKIKARNFATFDAQSQTYLYSGNYKDIFDFSLEGGGIKLEVEGNTYDTSGTGLNYGMRSDPWNEWEDNCKVDFRVWWYGKVEVWFDKMIVDDIWGNNLFHPTLSTRLDYENRITEEAEEFTDIIGAGSFFIDELTHSQIPCVKRVYELMKQTKPNAKLNFATTNYFNIRSYKNNGIGNRELLSQLSTESFNADAHEIQHVIPHILNSLDPKIPNKWKHSIPDYTAYLQKRVFGDKSTATGITPEDGEDWGLSIPSKQGSLVYQIELARQQRDSFAPGTQFIMQPQIHGVLRNDTTYYEGGIREPLNEEIEAQAMLSIAHGANGICWFVYYGQPTNFLSGVYYIFGLQNHDPDPANLHPFRFINMYGQNKWHAVRDMNIKIEHWKPVLDKIDWQSGWSVHKDGANHDIISDIKSIKRDPYHEYIDSPPCVNCDAANERYWEMGFFDPDFNNPEISSYDKSKYFIMVNRRCVPDEDNLGDFRQLRIKFDSTQLAGFINWKIIDLDTNNVVSTFNKNTTSYINMGEFKPGEGKLYKLAPVMQEVGTLVTNEDCRSFEFDCKGEVNNNGYDVNIRPGTMINFADSSARIIMTMGDFKSGISHPESTTPVFLKAKDGNFWKGIQLQNCPVVEMSTTSFENISPFEQDSTYAADIINCGYVSINSCSFTSDLNFNAGRSKSAFHY